ncbi:hypothetical protein Tco_1332492, partial [Tanacetum coccineum]
LVTKLSERIDVLEDDLKKTKLTYSAAVTKLILRIKKLDAKVKTGKVRKRARVVLSEDDGDDSSKQGRKLSNAEVQEKASTETEPIKGIMNTAGRTITYKRRSEEKRTRKDKGKAIMTEPEPNKKSKKEIEQERQWNEEEEQRAMSKAKSTKKIDWNDPSVIRYHALKMKPKTVAQARRNMYIEPMDLEHGSEIMKSSKKIEEEDVDAQKKMKEVSKESGAKRKNLPRKSTRSTVKRQKIEEDAEKEDLKGYLDIVPREEFAEDVESLSTKYPI